LKVQLTGVTPMLKAYNLTETIEFYTKTLRFQVAGLMKDAQGKPSWCNLKWGAAEIMFYSMDAVAEATSAPAMTGVVYFNPDNVRVLWETLRHTAKVEWGLQEMEYGMMEFAIRDCNGYILTFGQETGKAPSLPVNPGGHWLGVLD
jgi:uncharacterized glyoxalase superfamily protein PhnB